MLSMYQMRRTATALILRDWVSIVITALSLLLATKQKHVCLCSSTPGCVSIDQEANGLLWLA